jgi:hypothetical protein
MVKDSGFYSFPGRISEKGAAEANSLQMLFHELNFNPDKGRVLNFIV